MTNFKIVDVKQGSDEWLAQRLGKITASIASQIITGTGKLSASHESVINKAVAEKILGEPEESFQSFYMERGAALEPDALAFVNFTYELNFEPVGFLEVSEWVGCSPDALDLENKTGLELKCPAAHTMVKYLSEGKLPKEYFQQVQFSLMVTGFEKWHFCAYHPSFPAFHCVVERDEEYIAKMEQFVSECAEKIEAKYNKLKSMIEVSK